MKTPDEIKRWLACPLPVHYHIGDTEARLRVADRMTLEAMHEDAINLIVQLEADKEHLGLLRAADAEAYRHKLSELESRVSRWISVEEMVPVTTDDVLCCVTSGFQFVGYFEGIRGRWELYGQSRESVTHWMPLPEPPKEVAE